MHHMPNSYAKHPVPHLCYADLDNLPSFAIKCNFTNWSSDSYPYKWLTSHLANLVESILKLSHPVSHSLHGAGRRYTQQDDARELI